MWKKKMQEGLDELRDQLRRIDYQLLKSKNNECLEPKDFQPTTIKCRFGDLDINRRRYKLKKSNNEVEWVYLLDIYLELGYSGEYSQTLKLLLQKSTILSRSEWRFFVKKLMIFMKELQKQFSKNIMRLAKERSKS